MIKVIEKANWTGEKAEIVINRLTSSLMILKSRQHFTFKKVTNGVWDVRRGHKKTIYFALYTNLTVILWQKHPMQIESQIVCSRLLHNLHS